jgi:hypothetical protein
MFIELAKFQQKLSDIMYGTAKLMSAFLTLCVAEVSKEIAKQCRNIHNPDADLLS